MPILYYIEPRKESHWTRKEKEATRIERLWYPQPKLGDNIYGDPKIRERIAKLLEYGYRTGEIYEWFLCRSKNLRASTNTVEANVIWEDIKSVYKNRCAYCGVRTMKLQKDHVIPISKYGSDTMGNIVPACGTCNKKKHAKKLLDWSEFNKLQLHLLGF